MKCDQLIQSNLINLKRLHNNLQTSLLSCSYTLDNTIDNTADLDKDSSKRLFQLKKLKYGSLLEPKCHSRMHENNQVKNIGAKRLRERKEQGTPEATQQENLREGEGQEFCETPMIDENRFLSSVEEDAEIMLRNSPTSSYEVIEMENSDCKRSEMFYQKTSENPTTEKVVRSKRSFTEALSDDNTGSPKRPKTTPGEMNCALEQLNSQELSETMSRRRKSRRKLCFGGKDDKIKLH